MGVSLELVNFDDLFFRDSANEPVIINDAIEGSEDDKAAFNKLIYTKYTGDLLSNMPVCECGSLYGESNKNNTCTNCNTVVKSPIDQVLEPLVWIRRPNGVSKLINPIMWTMLKNKFTKSGFEIIRWICDTTYHPTVKIPPIMDSVMQLNIPRGYNNFVENFDKIIESLFNLKGFKPKKGMTDPLRELIHQYRSCIFSDYIPLVNRALLVIEESNVGTYVDPIITGAVDAIRTMAYIDSPLSNYSVRTKENRTIKTIALLAEFYDGLARTTLAKKEGIFRKHVFGTRSHFSFRAVISSLTANEDYDEIYIPWGIGVSVLRVHLENKLERLGYTPNEMVGFLNEHANKHHPLLEQLFKELIDESPHKGIPVIFQRNPSLERGSAQAMCITKVKSNVDDPTISLHILSVTGYNADYDGDQLNGTLSLDNWTAEELRHLAPHKSAFDLNAPRMVSRNLSMPKPVVATIACGIHHKDGDIADPVKLQRMEELLGV